MRLPRDPRLMVVALGGRALQAPGRSTGRPAARAGWVRALELSLPPLVDIGAAGFRIVLVPCGAPTMAPRSGGHFAAHAIGRLARSTRRSARPSASPAGMQSIRSGSAETMRARTSRLAAAMPGNGRLTAGMILSLIHI